MDRFALSLHWFNRFLEAPRRNHRPEFSIARDDNADSAWSRFPANACDKRSALCVPDANGVGLTGDASVTDVDVVATGG